MTISPGQSRAARGLVKISQRNLAKAAGVARSTITDFEREAHVPYPDNLAAIVAALEAAGVVFTPGTATTGPGVYLRDPLEK
jgi:transcriptional regulator with XRE-family HTH domain